MRHLSSMRRQRGLSLVELMIAMVLGLVIIAAAYNAYAGTSRSARFNSGLQTLQENGRYGIGVLQRGLRLAGYSPAGDLLPIDIAAGSDDAIVAQVTEAFDCGGGDTAGAGGIAINTYTFEPPTAGDPTAGSITCTGNVSATPILLVEDVESFRVLYGLDTDFDDNREPERFVSWNAGLDPAQIVALRVAILVNSGDPIRRRVLTTSHEVLDTNVTRTDALARHVYSTTIELRNGL